ncbi:NADH-quinone oxidoreductase subunit NuoG [Candidatus Portiera aleyrodidarum]|uniref:NADH-quinone oxidoreductase n=1 Tax=Candidatus Portiera aleyrodidarum MED (Bemisia tabaci) TaxID=1163752 RepID=A0AAU8RSC7_9GAMM|nr:NADH-quinone oxidoreductase subunit NuoG [Candidatus Portiera aleyrodidarum]AFQ23984.1 NADH dehydrogenase subunit G [Candidatus Portiera aleyrodidarum BT-B-HRs]AFS18749.1 NADH-ubiquinone oxidoreductase chain G [Candidatus Portiera aleyrodidarum BT-QVLC]AFT80376.1 ADH-ubiquinone oxidoreductase chain G [Candidatus Portiera aleyrodidarum BT-QVLC]AFT80656.1 ADH-ubiquinone oxidoreductase chain G [Candidatus Portiera aleyrodidarum BT-B-HRs]AJF23963.1 NADH dehydrogenase [Candidatus Portiera aleyro
MTIINVDNKDYEIKNNRNKKNLLEICLSFGIDIPYFCWHPILGSVGSCRQCIIKRYNNRDDTLGQIVIACTTSAIKKNEFITTKDPEGFSCRSKIIELMMTNHPHDCPVCEEGGQCHLQDMTVILKHNSRRYNFNKRTHKNQYLGPFINHEMNRCITCYRCIRFYKDYAGGKDLGVFGSSNNIYFGRLRNGRLENEFSGNLIEICPTGVFTDKQYSMHYARKWDLQYAPSICTGCSCGCNLNVGERYGKIRKIENRFNSKINHYFICDRGRFGYGYINSSNRNRIPFINNNPIKSIDLAIDYSIALLNTSNRVIGIGSPRASIESNFALCKLVGKQNFSNGIEKREVECLKINIDVLYKGALPFSSIIDIEDHDLIIILGEDITQISARIALAVRQAAQRGSFNIAQKYKIYEWDVKNINNENKHPIYIFTTNKTRLDAIAYETVICTKEEITKFGFAIANSIDHNSPKKKLNSFNNNNKKILLKLLKKLRCSKRPLIISGCSLKHSLVLKSAYNISRAFKFLGKKGSIILNSNDSNSVGVTMLGGKSLNWAIKKLIKNKADAVIILENNIYRRMKSSLVYNALKNKKIILIDYKKNTTIDKANVVLPAATIAEGNGTLINYEGRAQRFFKIYEPSYYRTGDLTKESWRWLHALTIAKKNSKLEWIHLNDVLKVCSKYHPAFNRILNLSQLKRNLARLPHRLSGRTAINSNIQIHEKKIHKDIYSTFTFSTKGYNSSEIAFAWYPGWNSPQAWNKFQKEIGVKLYAGNPGIRLINYCKKKKYLSYYKYVGFKKNKRWQIIPIYHLLGSEENSALTHSINKCTKKPYIKISKQDIKLLKVTPGSKIKAIVNNKEVNIIIKNTNNMRNGFIGFPFGIKGIPLEIFCMCFKIIIIK